MSAEVNGKKIGYAPLLISDNIESVPVSSASFEVTGSIWIANLK
jgi:hypothetical protein